MYFSRHLGIALPLDLCPQIMMSACPAGQTRQIGPPPCHTPGSCVASSGSPIVQGTPSPRAVTGVITNTPPQDTATSSATIVATDASGNLLIWGIPWYWYAFGGVVLVAVIAMMGGKKRKR